MALRGWRGARWASLLRRVAARKGGRPEIQLIPNPLLLAGFLIIWLLSDSIRGADSLAVVIILTFPLLAP